MITSNNTGEGPLIPAASTVDHPDNAPMNQPLYGTPFDERGFFDFPQQANLARNAVFKAETYLAIERANKQVTIYPTGFKWGYSFQDSSNNNRTGRSLSLTADVNPVTALDNVKFTASFVPLSSEGSPDYRPVPTGYIEFNNVTLNSVIDRVPIIVIGGVVEATTIPVRGSNVAAPQIQTILAIYSGDGTWFGTSTTYEETVDPIPLPPLRGARLDLNTSPPVVALGQATSFTATVSDNSAIGVVPTGLVTFADGSTILGTGVIDASGHASLSSSSLSLGAHTIIASYGGDATFDTATGSAPEEVDASGSVAGHVFLDSNGNGNQDAGEPGLANLVVTLGGSAPQTALTDGSGNYVFNHVLLGSYAVSIAGPHKLDNRHKLDNLAVDTTGIF